MNKLPFALIYTRLVCGIMLVLISLQHIQHFTLVAITLLTIGLLTDIFDGIIARKLNISSQKLRRLDSTIDQIFFICAALACYVNCSAFFVQNKTQLIVLCSTEAITYIVSFIKFKKEIATHTIGAKFWTLLLFTSLIQIISSCSSSVIFQICFWVGMATRLEIICIILILKVWANDIPSIFHALKLRNGEEIKRNKLFNG